MFMRLRTGLRVSSAATALLAAGWLAGCSVDPYSADAPVRIVRDFFREERVEFISLHLAEKPERWIRLDDMDKAILNSLQYDTQPVQESLRYLYRPETGRLDKAWVGFVVIHGRQRALVIWLTPNHGFCLGGFAQFPFTNEPLAYALQYAMERADVLMPMGLSLQEQKLDYSLGVGGGWIVPTDPDERPPWESKDPLDDQAEDGSAGSEGDNSESLFKMPGQED